MQRLVLDDLYKIIKSLIVLLIFLAGVPNVRERFWQWEVWVAEFSYDELVHIYIDTDS